MESLAIFDMLLPEFIMSYIVNIETSFPKNFYEQEDLIKKLKTAWQGKVNNLSRVKSIHENVLVKSRNLAAPLDQYFKFRNFDEKNDLFIKVAVELAEESIKKSLKNFDLCGKDISSLWSNTVTGFSIPSLEARIMNKIEFSPNTKRVPILGLGCMAGVAGINRVSDYLKAFPNEAAIFFSVELCSLTFQIEDFTVANLISTGLFGDGAAAVLMCGEDHPLKEVAKMKVIDTESIFFPNSEDVMGWNVGEKGLKIQLSKSVPRFTQEKLPGPIHTFLKRNDLELSNIKSFIAHPGGPKVLNALEKVLDLPEKGLKESWESLSENGNMSSVSVLDIFKRHMNKHISSNESKYALSLAMGPAFSSELGLLKWL